MNRSLWRCRARRWQLLTVVAAAVWCESETARAPAAEALPAVQLVRTLPKSESELAAAHERGRGLACEPLAPGQQLESNAFLLEATDAIGSDTPGRREPLPVPTARRPVLAVGLDITRDDQQQLPALSRGQIVDYLAEHYVSIQARVQRDLVSGGLYLHHRPVAGCGEYIGGRQTVEFTEPVRDAVLDMRSLGLYVPAGTKATLETLRTLVMVHKSLLLDPTAVGSKPRGRPTYELIFFRARPDEQGRGLTVHTILTSEHGQRWNYLAPFAAPKRPDDCGIRATVLFTEYKFADLIPSASLTRRLSIRTRTVFSRADLDRHALKQGWTGDALDNLTPTLDAIIDGRLTGRDPLLD